MKSGLQTENLRDINISNLNARHTLQSTGAPSGGIALNVYIFWHPSWLTTLSHLLVQLKCFITSLLRNVINI